MAVLVITVAEVSPARGEDSINKVDTNPNQVSSLLFDKLLLTQVTYSPYDLINHFYIKYSVSSGAAAPQAGQADYSQQWAEYYRSMGMIKEAEAIEMRVSRNSLLFYIGIDRITYI